MMATEMIATAHKSLVRLMFLLAGIGFVSCQGTEFSGNTVNSSPTKPADAEPRVEKPPVEKPPVEEPPVVDPTEVAPPEEPLMTGGGNDVYIGAPKVAYRIGDGGMAPGSACFESVKSSSLRGKIYVFSFEILKEETLVKISIDKVCGVDYRRNAVTLKGSGTAIPVQYLKINGTSHNVGEHRLKPGAYELSIASYQRLLDRDDFIVGNIHLMSEKPNIKPGTVKTK